MGDNPVPPLFTVLQPDEYAGYTLLAFKQTTNEGALFVTFF
jgi:hypothetical protein